MSSDDSTEYLLPPTRVDGSINLVPYDPVWAAEFEDQATRIRTALGPVATAVEHVGDCIVVDFCFLDVCELQRGRR